ncbi:MAG: hypothetical protein IJ002_08915 [Clostridia bacterium]|nr:hypothetical protein [Clostridia bacterium]
MSMTVNELITEIINGFEGEFVPDYDYLIDEYNSLVRSLFLMLPCADASLTLTSEDGKIECGLAPAQVRRVFSRGAELLRASKELVELLPEAKLYHAAEDGIYVTVNGECTVYYRALPDDVTSGTSLETAVFGDARTLSIVRAYLSRSAYLYLGDCDSADTYAAEYNSLLEDYKRENGVSG